MAECSCTSYSKPNPLSWVAPHIEVDNIAEFQRLFDSNDTARISALSKLKIGKRTVIEYAVFRGATQVFQLFIDKDAIQKLGQDIDALEKAIRTAPKQSILIAHAFSTYCTDHNLNLGLDHLEIETDKKRACVIS